MLRNVAIVKFTEKQEFVVVEKKKYQIGNFVQLSKVRSLENCSWDSYTWKLILTAKFSFSFEWMV